MSSRTLKNSIWFNRFGTANKVPCHWCGRMLSFDEVTLDHEPALAEGGRFRDKERIYLACHSCNNRRGAVTNRRIKKLRYTKRFQNAAVLIAALLPPALLAAEPRRTETATSAAWQWASAARKANTGVAVGKPGTSGTRATAGEPSGQQPRPSDATRHRQGREPSAAKPNELVVVAPSSTLSAVGEAANPYAWRQTAPGVWVRTIPPRTVQEAYPVRGVGRAASREASFFRNC